ncbi:hypothetical protein BpHYR1_037914, partial [Brachionus plicatilis]
MIKAFLFDSSALTGTVFDSNKKFNFVSPKYTVLLRYSDLTKNYILLKKIKNTLIGVTFKSYIFLIKMVIGLTIKTLAIS